MPTASTYVMSMPALAQERCHAPRRPNPASFSTVGLHCSNTSPSLRLPSSSSRRASCGRSLSHSCPIWHKPPRRVGSSRSSAAGLEGNKGIERPGQARPGLAVCANALYRYHRDVARPRHQRKFMLCLCRAYTLHVHRCALLLPARS